MGDFFLVNYSEPPIRALKTHEANENALRTLRPSFGTSRLPDIDATQIESHVRARLQQRRRVRRKAGTVELGLLKPTSVHQEFRVLRRIFGVAVKKKLVPSNPCAAVEFPVLTKGLFRPHYMTWSEQAEIEKHAPPYLRNVIRIITETGLRVYKELACMKKGAGRHLQPGGVHRRFEDSYRSLGSPAHRRRRGGVPEPDRAGRPGALVVSEFSEAGRTPSRFQEDLAAHAAARWCSALQAVRPPIHLRNPAQCRRRCRRVGQTDAAETDAKVFKKYSQMKLQMKREALMRLNRHAGDSASRRSSDTEGDE